MPAAYGSMSWSRRHRIEALSVGLGALLTVSIVALLVGLPASSQPDQVGVNLMVVKRLHPDWFKGDRLYGEDFFRHFNYTPSFLSLQTALARFLGDDPIAALRALYCPIGFLFLIGHYVFFRSLVGDPAAAALGALSAMTVRYALGGASWQFGWRGVGSVGPSTIADGLIPLLVLAFLRGRSHKLFPGFFLLVGGLANLYPISGLHLAQVTALTHLLLARFRWWAWKQVAVGVALFAVGVLPFLLHWLSDRDSVSDPGVLSTVRAAMDYRFAYLLFPQPWSATLQVALHAALPALVLVWLRYKGCWPEDLRTLSLIGIVALVTACAGTGVIQAVGVLTDRPYLDIMQLRANKFIYLPLLAAFPFAFRELRARRTTSAWIGLVLLFVLSLIPPDPVFWSLRRSIKPLLGLAAQATTVAAADAHETARTQEALWGWVVENAERNDLFLTDSWKFREKTLRPITGTMDDGDFMWLRGTASFYRWYVYIREVESCRARDGADCWFELARKYQARYVVVDPGVRKASPDGDFVRVWSESEWSVWRRSGVTK